MKRKIFVLIPVLIFLFLLNGCMPIMFKKAVEMQVAHYQENKDKLNVQFVKTSEFVFDTLSKNEFVKVVLTDNIPAYQEIGIISISPYLRNHDPLELIVEEAKIKARACGGDVIILYKKEFDTQYTSDSHPVGDNSNHYSYSSSSSTKTTYIFIIGKLKKD